MSFSAGCKKRVAATADVYYSWVEGLKLKLEQVFKLCCDAMVYVCMHFAAMFEF